MTEEPISEPSEVEETGLGGETSEVATLEEVAPGLEEVSDAVVEAFEALPEDFKARWFALRDMRPEQLVARLEREFDDLPGERREILISYVAARLGYNYYLNRTSRLTWEPLWDLLGAEAYEALDAHGQDLLWMVACSTQKIRPTLHPKSALAAIAIWRHGSRGLSEQSGQLMRTRGLPLDDRFLYDLVRLLGRRKARKEVPCERDLHGLARLQLEAGYAETAARIGGLYLVSQLAPWYRGTPGVNLVKACDRAAQRDPRRWRPWLELLADAAMAGAACAPWLERPVAAAIRLNLDEPARRDRLRAFHAARRYEASSARLRELYEAQLHQLRRARGPRLLSEPGRWLLAEVDRTIPANPTRAMLLLEIVLAEGQSGVESGPLLGPVPELLLALYVRCLHIEPHAATFVRQHHHQVDWSRHPEVSEEDLATYLVVSDYDAGFATQIAEVDGVRLAHVDNQAAARVRYFLEKRVNPNSLTQVVRDFTAPAEWMATAVGESRVVDALFDGALAHYELRSLSSDRREQVLSDLRATGVELPSYEAIAGLPITEIEALLPRRRQRRLLLAALAGAAAGGFGPATSGVSVLADMPVLINTVADVCGEFCWYYGFDPRQEPMLPLQILSVALGGSTARMVDPEAVRQELQEFLVRRALIMAALAQGALGQLIGPTLGMVLGALGHRPAFPMFLTLWRGAQDRNFRSRFAENASKVALPTADALIGAALNVALVYDLCESARAVLTDRFLARKYPGWEASY